MKKIIIVGGGPSQMPLIIAAKSAGYNTIVCDYAGKKCPGYEYADKFYTVSTRDVNAIIDVGLNEQIDGICSNSEPSMVCVAEAASVLGVTGNRTESIRKFISKNSFRELQESLNLFTPRSYNINNIVEAMECCKNMKFPIIVKPAECSGSRGNCKINEYNSEQITNAFKACQSFSRNNRVIIEEFVIMPSLTTIEGDIFVHNGDILWDGLFNTTRSQWAPMIPMTYSAPLQINDKQLERIKLEVSALITKAGIEHGQYNLECYFNEVGDLFVIEINVRQGGNSIPQFIKEYTGIDYDKLLVTTAVGDNEYWETVIKNKRSYKFIIQHSVFSQCEGIYDGLNIDQELQDKVLRVNEIAKHGEYIKKSENGSDVIAILAFEFSDLKNLNYYSTRIESLIQIKLK